MALRLRDSEQVVTVHGAHRKRLFGSRFGELYITNQRVAWLAGATPTVEFDRATVRAEKVPHKRTFILVLTAGRIVERFELETQHIDAIVALLAPDEDAPSINHYKS